MLLLMQMAFRNVFRNKRRTMITELAIIFGIVVIVFVSGLLKSMEIGWSENLIQSDLGHIQIMAKGLNENESLKYTIKNGAGIAAQLKSDRNIKAFSPRINVSGLVSTGENTEVFIGTGIDPETHLKMLRKATNNIVEGKYISPGDEDGALLGIGLAGKIHAKVGDMLTLAANDKYGSLNAVDIRVTGILKVGDKFTDDHLVVFHIKNARTLVSFDQDEVSKFVCTVYKTDDTIAVMNSLKKSFAGNDGIEIFSWHELSSLLNSVVILFSAISNILTLILLFLTLVGVMNTVLMSTFERTREIGTMMAIGSSGTQVVALFIMESAVIGVIGIIAGNILGIIVNIFISAIGGIHLPPPPTQTRGINLLPLILPGRLLFISGLVLITSVIAAIYPAVHASRQKPVEALRSN